MYVAKHQYIERFVEKERRHGRPEIENGFLETLYPIGMAQQLQEGIAAGLPHIVERWSDRSRWVKLRQHRDTCQKKDACATVKATLLHTQVVHIIFIHAHVAFADAQIGDSID